MAKDFSTATGIKTLGLQNNNPGNLRPLGRGKAWVGQTGSRKGFAVFKDISYGIRAIAKNAITQISIYGKDTVAKYITAYAPPTENDTAKYIKDTAAALGIKPTDKITVDGLTIFKLIKLHLVKEIGIEAKLITDTDIVAGIKKINHQS